MFSPAAHRRRGYGAGVSRRRQELLREVRTIVLNVAMDNDPALKLYRGLGFWPFCGYYEGVGELTAPTTSEGS
jgi:ribosomal protein S18 acetylase RimI-like enzyme